MPEKCSCHACMWLIAPVFVQTLFFYFSVVCYKKKSKFDHYCGLLKVSRKGVEEFLLLERAEGQKLSHDATLTADLHMPKLRTL